jgi:broad specificity phosphatase PhoE
MTKLVLCRHAENGNNNEQLARLAAELARLSLAAVYTSPLDRARRTALAIAAERGLVPIDIPDLREIEQGDLAGLAFDEYPAGFQAELLRSPATVRFPGGETYEDVRERMAAAIVEIVAGHPNETVAAISHAGAIRAGLATWLQAGGDGAFRIDQSFAAINVIDWTDGVPFVRLVNGSRAER